MSTIKLSFGKYKGKRLAKVPTDYLEWCRDSCSLVTPDLRRAIALELSKRDPVAPAPDTENDAPPEEPAATAPTISPLGMSLSADVRMAFKNLARKYHPDRGGSPEAMRALNEFHEEVQQLVTRACSR